MTDAPARELTPTDDGHDGREELDPELLELPDPPKRSRTATVLLLLVTALASLSMMLALRRDAAYAFAPPEARDIGDLNTVPMESLVENQFVHAQVMVGAGYAIRYERPLIASSFRLMPVAGRPNVWVELRVPPRGENMRWVPPQTVSGRLVRFASAGPRHRGLADAVHDATRETVPQDAWLLVDGDEPSDARWAVLLVLLFFGFAAWNTFATAKLLGKVKT